MFQDSATGMDGILQYSEDNNCPRHISAIRLNSPHVKNAFLWPEPKEIEEKAHSIDVNLATSEKGDIATKMAHMIGDYMQFPKSTIFLHCLGCISAAMTKSFKIDYGASSGLYPNLYIVTAQPPSTGKSAVNDMCFGPVQDAYKKYNEKNAKVRMQLERSIAKITKEIEKEDNDDYVMELLDQLEDKKLKLRTVARIKPSITNTTIEALERETGYQCGMFNLVSDEAETINVVLGAVYSDSKHQNKSNSEIILKAWDNGYVVSSRIGRDGIDSHVRGTICVLAQADTVDTILSAGASGRGVSERFFLLNEPSLLGQRDRLNRGRFNKPLHQIYENLIDNIVQEDELTLRFSPAADEAFALYEKMIEPKMSEMGDYSHNLLTGFIGKAAKQCRKLAAVLHVADNWQDGAERQTTISDDYAIWATAIFDELAKTFKYASDSMGHVGDQSEVKVIAEKLRAKSEKNTLKLNIATLVDSVKRQKPFAGSRNLTRKIKERVIPELERLNYCILDGQTIYINPRLK